jgi:hypothetical protein
LALSFDRPPISHKPSPELYSLRNYYNTNPRRTRPNRAVAPNEIEAFVLAALAGALVLAAAGGGVVEDFGAAVAEGGVMVPFDGGAAEPVGAAVELDPAGTEVVKETAIEEELPPTRVAKAASVAALQVVGIILGGEMPFKGSAKLSLQDASSPVRKIGYKLKFMQSAHSTASAWVAVLQYVAQSSLFPLQPSLPQQVMKAFCTCGFASWFAMRQTFDPKTGSSTSSLAG